MSSNPKITDIQSSVDNPASITSNTLTGPNSRPRRTQKTLMEVLDIFNKNKDKKMPKKKVIVPQEPKTDPNPPCAQTSNSNEQQKKNAPKNKVKSKQNDLDRQEEILNLKVLEALFCDPTAKIPIPSFMEYVSQIKPILEKLCNRKYEVFEPITYKKIPNRTIIVKVLINETTCIHIIIKHQDGQCNLIGFETGKSLKDHLSVTL